VQWWSDLIEKANHSNCLNWHQKCCGTFERFETQVLKPEEVLLNKMQN
jgi:hypothetical protein